MSVQKQCREYTCVIGGTIVGMAYLTLATTIAFTDVGHETFTDPIVRATLGVLCLAGSIATFTCTCFSPLTRTPMEERWSRWSAA